MRSNTLGVLTHPVATRPPCPSPAPPYHPSARERGACFFLLALLVAAAGGVLGMGIAAL